MLPPVSTGAILTAIEIKRREDADLRWQQSFRPDRRPVRRDTVAPRPARD